MDLAERLDRYIASKSRKPDPFASDTDAMRDQLTSGGMSEDQAFDLALAMARERERARDVPEENILGGDMSRLFQQDPTMMERIKRLPAQTLGAGEALASLGSAAALSVPSMVQSLVTGEKDPLGMMKRQMYVPKTEEGIGALTAVGELLPEIPAMPQVQLQALQAIPAGAVAAQAQRGLQGGLRAAQPMLAEGAERILGAQGLMMQAAPSTVARMEAPTSPLGFYDPVHQAALNIQRKQGPGQAFLNELQRSENVNKEFLESSGIAEKLRNSPSITREQVQELAKGAVPEIQEVVKGGQPAWLSRLDELENLGEGKSREEQIEYDTLRKSYQKLMRETGGTSVPTKYERYQLPGGENYREVLLTMPTRGATEAEAKANVSEATWNRMTPEQRQQFMSYPTEASKKAQFRSPHWDEPNVVAHIRMNDRTDADGKKVLFIEEIQSDWAQEGRKKGFAGKTSKLDEFFNSLREQAKIHYLSDDDTPEERKIALRLGEKLSQRDSIDSIAKVIGKERELLEARQIGESGIPSAPFVTNTKEWLDLSLKNIIKRAVDEGYDRVAFINGAQSADRYDLSKQIESVSWQLDRSNPNDHRIIISAEQKDDRGPVDFGSRTNSFKPDELSSVVGKELADKILESINNNKKWGILEGLDLEVGGEGMKAFYDKLVPERVNAVLKRFGGEKIGSVKLRDNAKGNIWADGPLEDGSWIVIDGEEVIEGGLTQQEAMGMANRLNGAGVQPGFDITPAMRERFQKPIPYKKGGLVQAFQFGGTVKSIAAGAKAGAKGAKAAKAAKSEDEKTLPMILERAPAKTKKELQEEAERIGRQIIGEHVTKPRDTANLAGYSKKVAERLKAMEEGRDYVLEQTTPVAPLASMSPAKGSILIGLPGDISIADKELKSLGNLEIGSQQQGGSLYGLPFKDDPEEVAKFWASNYGPANIFQNKVTEIGKMYPDQDILGAYMSMGRTGMNFAQHFADANLKAIRSAIRAGNVSQDDIDSFNKMIREGWSKKNKKTGEREYFKYPDFAGIENTGEAYAQMMRDPELRKWFNDRMKIGEETAPRGLPSGVDIEWAISEPALRNLEHSLVGYSVGKMQPGKELIAPVEHATYSHGIPGRAVGRLPGHVTARIAFPDASKVIAETKRPQDFTGTIQKVFPHQVVDQQWQDEVGQYLQYLKRITGKKKGGLVQAFQSGGKVISLAAKAAKAAKEAKVAKPVAKEAVPVLSTVDFADKNWRSAIDDVVKYMNNVGVPYAPWQFMRDKPDVPLGRIMDEIERDVYFVRSNPILPEGQVNLLEELFKKAREAEASYTRSGTPRDPMTGEPTMASGGLSFLAGGGKVVKAAAKAAKAAGTVVPKVIEPVRTTDIPEKEGVLRLFHGGSDPGFEAVPRGGRFDGFFALPDEVGGHGTGHNYFADIPQERILTNYDLNYELPLNKVVEAFEKTTGIKQGDSRFDPAWRAIVEETNANEMALAAKLADDYGDAGWEAQRMRGQLAKQLGYDAIEMQDEHGRSYLITSGVPLKYIGSKNK